MIYFQRFYPFDKKTICFYYFWMFKIFRKMSLFLFIKQFVFFILNIFHSKKRL